MEVRQLCADYPAARLVVFPEMHLCGGVPNSPLPEAEPYIESAGGPRDRALEQLAREHQIWLIPGSVFERAEDGTVANTVSAYSPDGRRVATYRKVFPWQPYERTSPGGEFTVFRLGEYGTVGLSICYDIWFPEHGRQLAWLGADAIINVARTTTSDRAQELILLQATAIANQVAVLSVNAPAPGGRGQSIAYDAEGRLRVRSVDASTETLSDVLDLSESSRVQREGTAGLNRVWSQLDTTTTSLPMYRGGRIQPRQS